MALLAETKRKTKFGLDPRNTSWSNDDSKIGQRLMEKMGWSKGKGLGANEDGMVDHIKASYKSDTRGLGSTPKDADAWVAHQDDFNELLKALNSENGGTPAPEKTDEKADGRKRFYGRFSRGRVQTLRSTEDLDCIFGKRKSGASTETQTNETTSKPEEDDDSVGSEKRHGLTTVTSSSSIQEYFAQKMAMKKAKQGTDGDENSCDESGRNSPEAGGGQDKSDKGKGDNSKVPAVFGAVGFCYDSEPLSDPKANCGDARDDAEVSGQIDRNINKYRGWYAEWSAGDDIDKDKEELQNSTSKKKKKRKSKEGDTVDTVDPQDAKARKKKFSCDSPSAEVEEGTPNTPVNGADSRSSSKKGKKKKSIENEELVNLENGYGEVAEKKKKRKRKGEMVEEEEGEKEGSSRKKQKVDKVGPQADSESTESLVAEGKSKKQKGSKDKITEKVIFLDTCTDEISSSDTSSKQKKKKKRKEAKLNAKEGNAKQETTLKEHEVSHLQNDDTHEGMSQKRNEKRKSVTFNIPGSDNDDSQNAACREKREKKKSKKKSVIRNASGDDSVVAKSSDIKKKKNKAVSDETSETPVEEKSTRKKENKDTDEKSVTEQGKKMKKHEKGDSKKGGEAKEGGQRKEKKQRKIGKRKKKKRLSGLEIAVQSAFNGSNISEINGYKYGAS